MSSRKVLRNLPAFCFHSSAMIKTCKRMYFSYYKPQRWRQVNRSQFINRETSFEFFNASSVLLQIEMLASFNHRIMNAYAFKNCACEEIALKGKPTGFTSIKPALFNEKRIKPKFFAKRWWLFRWCIASLFSCLTEVTKASIAGQQHPDQVNWFAQTSNVSLCSSTVIMLLKKEGSNSLTPLPVSLACFVWHWKHRDRIVL